MVYFVRLVSTGCVKIGFSRRVATRMQQLLRRYGPIELLAVVPGSARAERETHLAFASLALGGEWFSPGDALLTHVAALKSCEPVGHVVRGLAMPHASWATPAPRLVASQRAPCRRALA
jgi:hypothetical protein